MSWDGDGWRPKPQKHAVNEEPIELQLTLSVGAGGRMKNRRNVAMLQPGLRSDENVRAMAIAMAKHAVDDILKT